MVLGGKIKVLQEAFEEAFLDEPSGHELSSCLLFWLKVVPKGTANSCKI